MTQDCEKCNGTGLLQVGNGMGCPDCKGTGKVDVSEQPPVDNQHVAEGATKFDEQGNSESAVPLQEKKSFLGRIFN
jgi:DnaJ-class molecular chaperone